MPKIDVSVGELLDKITILKIKQEYITDQTRLQHINHELYKLQRTIYEDHIVYSISLYEQLLDVNRKLWDVEENLRLAEKNNIFDNNYIEQAGLDPYYNDLRFKIKRQIDIESQSDIQEQKSYKDIYEDTIS